MSSSKDEYPKVVGLVRTSQTCGKVNDELDEIENTKLKTKIEPRKFHERILDRLGLWL